MHLQLDDSKLPTKSAFEVGDKWVMNGYKEALDASNIVSITDTDGVIEYVNDKFCEISKYSQDELIGKPHNIVRHPDMPKQAFKDMWQTIKGGKIWQGIVKNRAKDGSEYIVDTTVVPAMDGNGTIHHYISIRHDITEVTQKDKLIEKQTTDNLTGLPNRVRLLEDLEFSESPIVSIINIDGFSEINDFYGLAIGDKLLISVAQKLKAMLATASHKLYRLHGDEFAVLTTDVNFISEHLHLVEESLKLIKNEPFDCDGQKIFITVTSGSAFESDTILGKANMALKHARNERKPHQVYDSSVKLEMKFGENIEWANKIHDAIGECRIVSYYQPIFNLESGVIEKYEALVRLVDSDGVIISPWQFLEIAKKTKQYPQITKIMLKNAVQTALETGYEISVNLSVEDLENEEIIAEIKHLLDSYGVGKKMVFELTETEEVKNYEAVASFIELVKGEYGSKVAIDDFGSGYSNFEHLLELDFDYLKIDGSIIERVDKARESSILVEAIIAFTQKLEIKTIAEFVSSEDIYKIVKDKGIHYAQGYYIGKPKSVPSKD